MGRAGASWLGPAAGALLVPALALVLLAQASSEEGRGSDPSAEGPSELTRYAREAREDGEPLDWYNYGTALLLHRRHEQAAEALRRSADSERPTVRHYGLYNTGLAEALLGREATEPGRRRTRLLAAREALREVLRASPDDEDARWNLEVVQSWLDRQERQQRTGGGPRGGGGGAAGGGSGAGEGAGLDRREAEALLDAAGRAESGVRERLLRRSRFRDPVVRRNW